MPIATEAIFGAVGVVLSTGKRNSMENPPEQEEAAWSYRGYHLKSSEFVTAMVHLFRAEIQRANVWRQRLDTTTNWAVIATGAALSIAFSQPNVHHGVIILNTLLITWFLFIEARRYRYYELWSYRIRLMETDFYAAMLVPPFQPSAEWAESLAESLLSPSFPISMWEAFGRRLRRNYLWMLVILGASWIGKNYLFPNPVTSLAEFVTRCAVGPISGQIVIGLGIAYYCFLVLVAVATLGMTEASGEILSRFGTGADHQFHGKPGPLAANSARPVPGHRRNQLLALIITDKSELVSARILTNLKRGVTAIEGKGMYTGHARSILLCALTVTEVHNLKAIIAREDPQAFVIVSPSLEILGRGFSPLDDQ